MLNKLYYSILVVAASLAESESIVLEDNNDIAVG